MWVSIGPNIDGVFEKLQEEVQELREAISEKQQADIEDEVGDLFFVLVNIARVLKVDSESALEAGQSEIQNKISAHGIRTRQFRKEARRDVSERNGESLENCKEGNGL